MYKISTTNLCVSFLRNEIKIMIIIAFYLKEHGLTYFLAQRFYSVLLRNEKSFMTIPRFKRFFKDLYCIISQNTTNSYVPLRRHSWKYNWIYILGIYIYKHLIINCILHNSIAFIDCWIILRGYPVKNDDVFWHLLFQADLLNFINN